MSLHRQHVSPISQGWLRAVILLVVYISLSIVAGMLLPTFETWITFNLVAAFALVYLFRKYADKKSFSGIGFDFSRFYPDALVGACLGICLICAGSLLILYLDGMEWIDIAPNLRELFNSAMIMLMVAVADELVFRGYVLRNLMKSVNKWLALFLSALLFTAVHLTNPEVPATGLLNTFLGGLLLGITFINTRKLWLPVSFHFFWNFMQGPVIGFPVSGIAFDSLLVLEPKGNPLISGGNYGFEASLVCSLLLLIAFIVWSYFESKRSYSTY